MSQSTIHMPRATQEDCQHPVHGARTLQLSSEARIWAHPSDQPRGVTSREQENRKRKAAGMDNIPNLALKTAVNVIPETFLDMYNTRLAEETFPDRWKQHRLILLPKGNKPPDELSSYRPLCMLDSSGKTLERFIFNQIEGAAGHLLADNQYGFRKERSAIDAINQVVGIGNEAISGKRWKGGSKKYCRLITLDVRNAFNSARGKNICQAVDKLDWYIWRTRSRATWRTGY